MGCAPKQQASGVRGGRCVVRGSRVYVLSIAVFSFRLTPAPSIPRARFAERVRHGKSARGPWSKNYQSKIHWTVRELFRYLHETERVLSDITLGLPPLHKARHLPKNLMNREQVARLLHQPNPSTACGTAARPKCSGVGHRSGMCKSF